MKIKVNYTDSDDFKQLLKAHGYKLTRQRKAIIDYFLERGEHYSIEGLYNEIKSMVPSVGFATVYRTLRLLTTIGLATKRYFSNNVTLFEPIKKGRYHYHMICIGCGKIVEFSDERVEPLQDEIAKRYGFSTISHKLEIYGYCKDCQKKMNKRGGNAKD